MFSIGDLRIAGISTRFPAKVERTDDYIGFSGDEAAKFKKFIGIEERRIASPNTCASDMCFAACVDLLEALGWQRESVGALILITQTGDYPVPATALLLQSKLGLPSSSICFDVNLGCSSFPFGLMLVSSLMRSSGINRALLAIGDISSRVCAVTDKSAYPLFGDAGCAIAIEAQSSGGRFYYDLNSDGSGYKAIIVESGGLASRNPVSPMALETVSYSSGIERSGVHLTLNGPDIFSFAISKVPASIGRVVEATPGDISKYDYLVLHQANKMINDQIVRKVGMPKDRSLSSLRLYGNTSSVSIPLTITSHAEVFLGKRRRILACGFGVGLSWGAVDFCLDETAVLVHRECK